jgi:hypothetical protein
MNTWSATTSPAPMGREKPATSPGALKRLSAVLKNPVANAAVLPAVGCMGGKRQLTKHKSLAEHSTAAQQQCPPSNTIDKALSTVPAGMPRPALDLQQIDNIQKMQLALG